MEMMEMKKNIEVIVCEEEGQTESRRSILDMPVAEEIENRPQPVQSKRKGKYQRPDVSEYDRLNIAKRYLDPNRVWGEVTKMAQEYALSRVTIYAIVLRIVLCLQPDVPGPKISLARQLRVEKEEV